MFTLHSLNPIGTQDTQNDTQKITIVDLIKTEIRKNPSITREELAKKLSKSKATIARAIKNCDETKFVGSSKTGHWEIIPKKRISLNYS